jgi:hypothetical protein
MRFRIGGVFAKCSSCNGEDFYPALRLTADRRDVYVCAACENQVFYPELVERTRREGQAAEVSPQPQPDQPT